MGELERILEGFLTVHRLAREIEQRGQRLAKGMQEAIGYLTLDPYVYRDHCGQALRLSEALNTLVDALDALREDLTVEAAVEVTQAIQ